MIHLSLPHLTGKEQEYTAMAIESGWIVPLGPFVDEFEQRLGGYLGTENVVALSSGTAAIHLALVMAGVKAGDEVICQDLTFSASCNPIVYLGAKPVFVDSEPATWNMDPELLEEAIIDRYTHTGHYPTAIIAVHLYGMPADMQRINEVAARYRIPVIEDAAEALGSTYKDLHCGSLGLYGALSFNGNKIITTSGGGALICPDKESADKVKYLSTQAREPRPYYYHTTIGYNYRLSNVSAAIGCAQVEKLPERVDRRRAIHDFYKEQLGLIPAVRVHTNPSDDYHSNYWLTTILIDPELSQISPDQLRVALLDQGIESRLIWRPMHMQPVFEAYPFYGNGTDERIFNTGLCLPSGSILSDSDLDIITKAILKVFRQSDFTHKYSKIN